MLLLKSKHCKVVIPKWKRELKAGVTTQIRGHRAFLTHSGSDWGHVHEPRKSILLSSSSIFLSI